MKGVHCSRTDPPLAPLPGQSASTLHIRAVVSIGQVSAFCLFEPPGFGATASRADRPAHSQGGDGALESRRRPDDVKPRVNLPAAALAWILPGLGHWVLGYKKRAAAIGAGVLSLYFAGLLVGGVDVIDRRGDFWWYCGQFIVGPITPAIDAWIGAQLVYEDREGHPYSQPLKPWPADLAPDDPFFERYNLEYDPDYRPAFSTSLARVNEVGTLYTTIAGMLNLLAILDCVYMAPLRRERRAAGGASSSSSTPPREGGRS